MDFRNYVNESGVLESLTKLLVGLREHPQRNRMGEMYPLHPDDKTGWAKVLMVYYG